MVRWSCPRCAGLNVTVISMTGKPAETYSYCLAADCYWCRLTFSLRGNHRMPDTR